MPDAPQRREMPDWIADHMNRYIETDGEDGHQWRGLPTLLLTTTGRRSGERITTPLIYGENEGRYLIVASMGGAPKHPGWYFNLDADSAVELQVGADKFRPLPVRPTPKKSPNSGSRCRRSSPTTSSTKRKPTEASPW